MTPFHLKVFPQGTMLLIKVLWWVRIDIDSLTQECPLCGAGHSGYSVLLKALGIALDILSSRRISHGFFCVLVKVSLHVTHWDSSGNCQGRQYLSCLAYVSDIFALKGKVTFCSIVHVLPEYMSWSSGV